MPRLSTNRREDQSRWERNRRHWEENLDAQNLGRDGAVELEKDLALYDTADFRRAVAFLGPLQERLVLDLGGGLGLAAILFARAGARVIVADLSLPRLRAARDLAEKAGVSDRTTFMLCGADALPFADGTLDRQFTKSVLIHTPLALAAKELNRTLADNGRACFIEPFDANPFVNLYRRLAAPGEWRDITSYFNPDQSSTLLEAFAGRRRQITRLYLFAFFATPFNYVLRWPGVYRFAEAVLIAVDAVLFRLAPNLRSFGWFGLFKISASAGRGGVDPARKPQGSLERQVLVPSIGSGARHTPT